MEIAVINCRLQQLFLCVICSGKWYLFRKLMTPFINLRSHPLIKRTATRLKWPPGPAGVGPAAAQLRPQQNTTIHWLIKTAALLEKITHRSSPRAVFLGHGHRNNPCTAKATFGAEHRQRGKSRVCRGWEEAQDVSATDEKSRSRLPWTRRLRLPQP